MCYKSRYFKVLKKKKKRKEKERIDNYLTKLISLKKYSTGTEDINPITDRLVFEERKEGERRTGERREGKVYGR